MMIITAVLYITVYLGMIFQIALGAYQVIVALIMLFSYKQLLKRDKSRILVYWLVVFLFALFWSLGWLEAGHEIFPMVIYPMSIAVYFTFFLEKLGTKNQE